MSYSRWVDSKWYTYWHCDSGPTRDEQIFQVCLGGYFSYKELKEDLEGCLCRVMEKDIISDKLSDNKYCQYFMELGFYMLWFIDDVEKSFPDSKV